MGLGAWIIPPLLKYAMSKGDQQKKKTLKEALPPYSSVDPLKDLKRRIFSKI